MRKVVGPDVRNAFPSIRAPHKDALPLKNVSLAVFNVAIGDHNHSPLVMKFVKSM